MNTDILRGTGVALITPLDIEKKVDYDAITKIVSHIISGGVEFIVLMGTTAESVTLKKDEKKNIIKHVKDITQGKIPIIIGIGGNDTQEITEQIKEEDFSGISGILSVSPYYNKPSQKGIYEHYKQIAQVSPVPIILYNVPGRTSSNISPETTLKLANDFKNIVAIKEASGNFSQIMEIVNNKPENFIVLSGDDAITLPLISVGVTGVISVVANAMPNKFSSMVRYALNADFEKAAKEHYKLLDFTNLIFEEGNPAGVKSALKHLGLCENYVRLPLVEVSETLSEKIKAEIVKIINN